MLHFTLPVLMLYLFAGTIAQKYIGLYDATKIFFSEFIIWAGVIPLPGLPIIIGIIAINLCCKLLFKSPWQWKNAGIIVTHIGVLLLLIGGFFTALFSHEGYIALAQDEQKSYITDFHKRVLVLTDENGNDVRSVAHQTLDPGDILTFEGLPFSIEVKQTCRNCDITARDDAADKYQGMARHMKLSTIKPAIEDEENLGGITIDISGSEIRNGTYVVIEDVPQVPELSANETIYKLSLRRERRTLPFDVTLLSFTRDMHPGTEMAKAYQSRIRIQDGDAKWESLISMNEPLRYKGYSLYQSSFIESDQGDISVLAVVWNAGRIFPYLSGITVCFGIIMHLFLRRRRS